MPSALLEIIAYLILLLLLYRLYGSYGSLKGGRTSEAMEDFTGGVVETFNLTKVDYSLFQKIEKCAKKASLMSTSIALVTFNV